MFKLPLLATPIIFLLALTGCGEGVLSPAGPVADAEHVLLLDALAIMLAIIIPVMLTTLAFAWWFRAGNARVRYQPDWSYSGRVELIVWSIPVLVIMFLGGVTWISSHALDPAHPLDSPVKPLEVQVVSLDWKWLFIYPEQQVASINRLVAPAGGPLHLHLTSASVMNVFFVPRLGSEIYTMNGMTTQLYLQADKPGSYPGLSAHFSGDGFSNMAFTLDALPPSAFANWVAQAKSAGAMLDEAAYRGLLKQSRDDKAITYRAVQPGLYDDIVQQKLPPGDGPPAGSPQTLEN